MLLQRPAVVVREWAGGVHFGAVDLFRLCGRTVLLLFPVKYLPPAFPGWFYGTRQKQESPDIAARAVILIDGFTAPNQNCRSRNAICDGTILVERERYHFQMNLLCTYSQRTVVRQIIGATAQKRQVSDEVQRCATFNVICRNPPPHLSSKREAYRMQ